MRQYENEVQKVKHEVLSLMAKAAMKNTLIEEIIKLPKLINPGPEGRVRCCVHHERAVTCERIDLIMGGNKNKQEIVEVLPSACDQCLVNRYVVTETCRGCLAHRCVGACPVDAISIRAGKAEIDHKKCIECGKCKDACPYSAIADVMRPCRKGCPTNAIHMDENKTAVIDYDLCISCGACVYNCPFGAIQDKSEILEVIKLLDSSSNVYAILAPAFATQFQYVPLEQVITGIKKLGFRDVVEVALGADLIVKHEVEEFMEKETDSMTSSCCPGFVNLIKLNYPELLTSVSNTVSPMVATARLIQSIDPQSEIVFIGPCIAKKHEKLSYPEIAHVLTFEELDALIDAKGIDLETLEGSPLNNASYHGRKFAASGGVSSAVVSYYKDLTDKPLDVINCDGIKECDKALKQLKFKKLKDVFIEGMACKGGCIKGPVTMHHGPKDVKAVDNYAKKAYENEINTSIEVFNKITLDLRR
ncbi:4Fe-4S dicluster domain-containing protein [Acidaminobacter sp. JC074]|uniref:monomeric [FeFe] hydrogenase n=1 Tax=Acidaminobacter sp. JC074 TaxID=2530199 RepID=UPI001F0ED566|nr:monomeric [FeFe] hydrogenase [Acidaminobacter sp. JC074]MCH4888047.1 4Fe-4S dicluster domain-containing protein [Acidaminobacter sp. JC074]